MIKVLFALNGPMYKGGTEAVVLSYYNNLNSNLFRIEFLIHADEDECKENLIHKELVNKGTKIYYVTPRGKSIYKNIKELKRFFETHYFDIVHSHMDVAGYFVLKAAKKAGVKVCVSHSHNTSGKVINGGILRSCIYTLIHEYLRKKLPAYTDVRIACSSEAGKWLFGSKSFILVHNAIDADKYRYDEITRNRYREMLGVSNSTYVLGHVGRFTEQKNHSFLIDIFSEYHKINEDSRLILVGTGHLESDIKEKVQMLNLQDSVKFLGLRNDVDCIMQMIDLFILPSFHEGLPVVGIEAQASGVCCLVSDTVSSEVKLSKNVFFLGLSCSAKEWALKIEEIRQLPNDRQMGYNSIVSAGYRIQDIANQLEKIYLASLSSAMKTYV